MGGERARPGMSWGVAAAGRGSGTLPIRTGAGRASHGCGEAGWKERGSGTLPVRTGAGRSSHGCGEAGWWRRERGSGTLPIRTGAGRSSHGCGGENAAGSRGNGLRQDAAATLR